MRTNWPKCGQNSTSYKRSSLCLYGASLCIGTTPSFLVLHPSIQSSLSAAILALSWIWSLKCTNVQLDTWTHEQTAIKSGSWLHLQFCQIFRCVGYHARREWEAWATKWTQPCLRRGWHLRLLCREGIRWRWQQIVVRYYNLGFYKAFRTEIDKDVGAINVHYIIKKNIKKDHSVTSVLEILRHGGGWWWRQE